MCVRVCVRALLRAAAGSLNPASRRHRRGTRTGHSARTGAKRGEADVHGECGGGGGGAPVRPDVADKEAE